MASTVSIPPVGAVLLMSFEGQDCVRLLISAVGENLEPKQEILPLDGSFTVGRARKVLRGLGWRGGKGSVTYVVLGSEDVFLQLEDFPTGDAKEARAMAQGWMHGMVEIDPDGHTLSVAVLDCTSATTSCALAIFQRERIERVFEVMQTLGVAQPRFIPDVLALGIGADGDYEDGDWGWIAQNRPGVFLARGLRIREGRVQAVYQRFLAHDPGEGAALETLAGELFHEKPSPSVTWQHFHAGQEAAPRLVRWIRFAGSGKIPSFELQPAFWRERLERLRVRKGWMRVLKLATACYLAWILFLGGLSLWHWKEWKSLGVTLRNGETPFKEAMELKRELTRTRASLDPSGNVLEVLRQVAESMPEGLTLESFSYRFQDSVKLRGVGSRGEVVYDFVSKLRTVPVFRAARVESVGENPVAGDVNWQIVSAFHPLTPSSP